ncbi:MAG: DUF6276 family protein [Halanaeroarchaeum sp.]
MRCPNCGEDTVPFPIPDAVAGAMPDDRPGGALCTSCLTVSPTDDPPDTHPDFGAVSDAFPGDGEAGATIAALLGLLDRLALYREEIDAIARHAERLGVDVMLVLDRLAADPDVEPAIDLDRRRDQLEQLLA